jgi:hypothetical protein
MATSPSPLQQKTAPKPTQMDLMLGGLPAAQSQGGQGQAALAAMLGPGANLSPYLKLAGSDYADQLDQLMLNPMNAWF